MDIYSNLVRFASKSGYLSDLSEKERVKIADVLGSCVINPVTAPISEWNFVQAIYSVDKDMAISMLKKYSSSKGHLTEVARSTLNSLYNNEHE